MNRLKTETLHKGMSAVNQTSNNNVAMHFQLDSAFQRGFNCETFPYLDKEPEL